MAIRNFDEFARRLNSAAKKAGYRTPADLANATGMNRITLGSYFRGERAASLEACIKLSAVLDVSPSWLHSGKESAEIDQLFRGAKREIVEPNADFITTSANKYSINNSISPNKNMGSNTHNVNFSIDAPKNNNSIRLIPLYSAALAGADGSISLSASMLEEIEAPAAVAAVPDAYAVRVVGESMEPRYFSGETIYIHPRMPVRRGDFVLVQVTEDGNPEAVMGYVKRLISVDDKKVVIEQLNPKKEISFPRTRVKSVHKIVLAG